jgi:hypothetical protein
MTRHHRRRAAYALRRYADWATDTPDGVALAVASLAWTAVQLTLGVEMRAKAVLARRIARRLDVRRGKAK